MFEMHSGRDRGSEKRIGRQICQRASVEYRTAAANSCQDDGTVRVAIGRETREYFFHDGLRTGILTDMLAGWKRRSVSAVWQRET